MLAGPGSGKTKVIAHRIAWLVEEFGVLPGQILAVTFTNKAAGEMKKRVREFIGEQEGSMWAGTFHSICLRILKRETDHLAGYTGDFVIYDRTDQLNLMKDCLKELDYGGAADGFAKNMLAKPAKNILTEIDLIENGQENSFKGDFSNKKINGIPVNKEELYRLYKQKLLKLNAMTFNDLLLNANKLLLEDNKVRARYQEMFSHILVDEYQDTNSLQHRFVKTLSDRCGNIFVVGDENQSIYGWRGADINNILNFEKDFPRSKVIKLERNYRSTGVILGVANAVMRKGVQSRDKTLWTDKPKGDNALVFEAYDVEGEGEFVAQNITRLIEYEGFSAEQIAVFYRANFQSKVLEDILAETGIPYRVVSGVGFYQRAEIKDVLAYLRLLQNPDDDVSFNRVINVPPRKIGEITLKKLASVSSEASVSLFRSIDLCSASRTFSESTLNALFRFRDMIKHLREHARRVSVVQVMDMLFDRTGYLEWIKKDQEKLKNVKELRAGPGISEELSLSDFLSDVSLTTDQDRTNTEEAKVSLMTIHASKGLEFPVVFLVGANQELFTNRKGAVEEERRLFYVAVTRAERLLYISYTLRLRPMHISGRRSYSPFGSRSVFLDDLPKDTVSWNSYNRKDREYGENNSDDAERLNFPHIRTRRNMDHGLSTPTLAESDIKFKIGRKVVHKTFGSGVIRKIEFRGDAAVVTVNFSAGLKKINAKFLSPS